MRKAERGISIADRAEQNVAPTLFDRVFGSPEAPGFLHTLFTFLRNYHRAQFRLGEPIDLKKFVAQNPEVEDGVLWRSLNGAVVATEIAPGTPVGSFLLLYQFPRETSSETLNATVHGFMCTALARTATGYRLYWGIYVIPVSWPTRPYLMAIAPFRRVLYPAMLRRIRRAWLAAYGTKA